MTTSRVRRVPDVLRMGKAMSQPGIDPRTWVSTARVDSDPAAIHWDPELGPIVDVTFTGGPLDGEGPVACRVAGVGRGPGVGHFIPVRPGDEVQVAINSGNPEEGPVIVGALSNAGGCEAPTEVCGLPVLAAPGAVSIPLVGVAPGDTTMIVSSGNLAEQYDGAVIRQSATMITETTGPASLLLGNRKAAEAYLLGSSYTAAEASMLNALAMAFDTLAASAAAPPLVPLGAGFTTAASAIRQLMPASYLSVKIMGE